MLLLEIPYYLRKKIFITYLTKEEYMKHVFSYGIWLGAILSYLLLFFEPTHTYVPYANNIITLYEVVCWVVFVILAITTLIFALGNANKAEMIKTGTPEQFAKALEFVKKPKLHHEISRYIHYVFIIFIGVFVGDLSMAFILTTNAILFIILKGLMKSLLKEAANG